MTAAVTLLDANVLYPAPLRDLLLQMSFAGLFQARWSAEYLKRCSEGGPGSGTSQTRIRSR
jgi:hypothetical protein